jgi:hypothetical protein
MELKVDVDAKKMLSYIKKTKYRTTKLADGCHQSFSNKILEDKILEKEKLILMNAVRYYLKTVFHYSGKFKMGNSWLTKTFPKCESQIHCHKNNWISACYYPEENKGFKISFIRGSAVPFIDVDYDDYDSIYSCERFNLVPKKEGLVIFPSYVQHRISKNLSNKNRYSLAFNINPIGHFKKGSDGEVIYD